MKYIMMVIFLSLPLTAHAGWINGGNPELAPMNVPPPVHVEAQHREQPPWSKGHNVTPIINYTHPVHSNPPVNYHQDTRHHENNPPDHSHHRWYFYKNHDNNITYIVIDPTTVVPDGFETILVNGQIYFYEDGVFYQQVEGQLVPVPPVLGAVVDYIPDNYVQVTSSDGSNYLLIGGTYYEQLAAGFEVVQGLVIDQG